MATLMFVVPDVTEWVPINPPVELRNGDSILIHGDIHGDGPVTITVKRVRWWRRLARRFALWTLRLTIITLLALTFAACNDETSGDCGKQGILTVKEGIVQCNNGKAFRLK